MISFMNGTTRNEDSDGSGGMYYGSATDYTFSNDSDDSDESEDSDDDSDSETSETSSSSSDSSDDSFVHRRRNGHRNTVDDLSISI